MVLENPEFNFLSNIYRIEEKSLNLSFVNDQTLRSPAMKILGNPIGAWIMICHVDEFWIMDPRRLIRKTLGDNPKINLIRPRILTASPLESEYKKAVREIEKDPTLVSNGLFHIQNVSKWVHHPSAPSGLGRMGYSENRLFCWQEGMQWGTQTHSWVVPDRSPGYSKRRIGVVVHFKLHDFSSNAFTYNSLNRTVFSHSKLQTGLTNSTWNEGWLGYFLDISLPKSLETFPPQSLDTVLADICVFPKYSSLCTINWNIGSTFATEI